LREKEFKENSASKQTETVTESTTQAEKPTEPAKKGRKMESPMPGIILKVEVKKGDMVKRGDRVLVLEAMKMENDILAEYTGEVVNVFVNSGDSVQAGAPLIEIA